MALCLWMTISFPKHSVKCRAQPDPGPLRGCVPVSLASPVPWASASKGFKAEPFPSRGSSCKGCVSSVRAKGAVATGPQLQIAVSLWDCAFKSPSWSLQVRPLAIRGPCNDLAALNPPEVPRRRPWLPELCVYHAPATLHDFPN